MNKYSRIISSLAAISALSLFSCQNNDGEGAEYDYDRHNAIVNFELGGNLLSYDTTFNYSDSLLVGADNKAYSKSLAKFAFALAFDCYDNAKISLKGGKSNPTDSSDNTSLYGSFEFKDAKYVKLSGDDYISDKWDLTNAIFAHKEITQDNKTIQIFTMTVQGSTGQDQWFSNFDVGDFSSTNYATLSAKHSVAVAVSQALTKDPTADTTAIIQSVTTDMTTNYTVLKTKFRTEHKGFALAAKRIQEKFEAYVTEHKVTDAEKIILLTGHSRGAAITNILGKVYEDDTDWTSFCYGFATPRTTTNENAASYKTIFNILNSDDLVTELPLKKWGFVRYGTDKSASISKDYLAEWKNVIPFASNYTSANAQDVSYLEGVATDRADLYKLEDASMAKHNKFALAFDTEEAAKTKLAYLQAYGLGLASYDPYSEFAVVEDEEDSGKKVLYGAFRPQFFLNTLVLGICLASVDTTKATEFVMTMISGLQPLHQNAILKMSGNLTGFAYSHSAPCYSILTDNL